MRDSLFRWWQARASAANQEKLEAEMKEEMRFHLAMEERYLAARGTGPDQAKRSARILFGAEESFKEEIRESMPLRWLTDLRTDVGYALKSLRRSPGFTAFAVIAFGIGIGANATAFGFVDPIAFRKLPIPDADRLIAIYATQPDGTRTNISYENVQELMQSVSAVEDVAAFTEHPVTVVTDKLPSVAYAVHASDNYFSLLGLTAERGRFFQAGDQSRAVGVIGHTYWQSTYKSDSQIIGRRVSIDGVSFTIVGVAPRDFYGTRLFTYEPAFWLPVESQSGRLRRGVSNVIGRLRPGVTVEQAQQELDRSGSKFTVLSNASPINPWLASRDRIELMGRLLILGVCMVLFVACADVANLLLVRMTVRRQEITTRIALGVSASRLARQLLTESVVIVLLGALAAIPLALIALNASSRLTPPLDFGISFHPSLDKRVLIFTAITSLATAVVFGLAPLIQLWRRDLNPDRYNSLRAAGGLGSRVRSALVIAQVALSVVAIAAAGLLYRGLSSARAIDVGFDATKAVVFTVDLIPTAANSIDRAQQITTRLKSALSALPGVTSVSFASSIPLDGETRTLNVAAADNNRCDIAADYFIVDDDYFNTLGIPVRLGQGFSAADTSGLEPVVVNEILARMLWGPVSPVGRRLQVNSTPAKLALVIGVVGSSASRRLGDQPRPILWRSTRMLLLPRATIVMRSDRDVVDLQRDVEGAIRSIDPAIPIVGFRSLEDRLELAYTAAQTGAVAGLIFGTLTTILAALGLFGLLLFNITQRTREIGIRRALGASSVDVLKMVTSSSIRLTLIGTAIGMTAVLLIPPRISEILYGVSPRDPALLVITPVAFLVISVLATIGPAWKASRIEPFEALRVE
jgi:putative ABC transport system permease protein